MSNIPYEIISNIVDYVSNEIGFDYKYCRYRKIWRFFYNKSNKIYKELNDLLENKWCVRRFYDMSNPETRKIEGFPNFVTKENSVLNSSLGVLYYTPPIKTYDNKKIKVDVYTTITGNTVISLYKKSGTVVNMFHKITIPNNVI